MANFVLLYIGGGTAETETAQADVMQAWGTWFTNLGSALVDGGQPFASAVKSIASDRTVSEGPIGTQATGYTIITADSLDAAVEMAQSCPQLQSGGQISVYETYPVI